MTSNASSPSRTTPACLLLPLLSLLLLPPALGFSPSPPPPPRHASPHASPHRSPKRCPLLSAPTTSAPPLGHSDTTSRRFPGLISPASTASDSEKKGQAKPDFSGEDKHAAPGIGRRAVLAGLPFAAAWFAGARSAAAAPANDAALSYNRWWVVPIAPYKRRKTVRSELVPGEIWGFDQLLGALYVQVPNRMTIVRLAPPGQPPCLLVFAPVAPTQECLTLVRELEAEYGPVKHIILSSPALEHKVNAGPFARCFKGAQLWVAPDQYAFPFGLENVGRLGDTQLFWGLNPKTLPPSADMAPWKGEMEHSILGPIKSRGGDAPGLFEDVTMLHVRSKSLLVTDLVQTIPREIPEVLKDDPRALLFHARDNAFERVEDTPEVRQRGWDRIALFSLFFQPGGVDLIPWGKAFPDMAGSKMKELGWNGLFPFVWRNPEGPHPAGKAYWRESYDALVGTCFVPAVLQLLILDREPKRVLAFADKVAEWDFERIIPAHLGPSIRAGPAEWRAAFRFLEDTLEPFPGNLESLPLSGDAKFLQDISTSLTRQGAVGVPDAGVEAARAHRRMAGRARP
mmetsp:Transcript_2904/g.6590  ORF Transcript_2904/g.6590 Transcript_2904/m.6590 type:complete len:569 (+) Transcript_2904:243-1949(+)